MDLVLYVFLPSTVNRHTVYDSFQTFELILSFSHNPAGNVLLPLAGDGQRMARYVLGDGGAGADIAVAVDVTGATSSVPEPMKTLSPMRGGILFFAVVVAGDGAGADIDFAADRWRRRYRTGAWPWIRGPARFFSFRRNCPSWPPANQRAVAHVAVRAELHVLFHDGIADDRTGQEHAAVTDAGIFDEAVGVERHIPADAAIALDDNPGADQRTAADRPGGPPGKNCCRFRRATPFCCSQSTCRAMMAASTASGSRRASRQRERVPSIPGCGCRPRRGAWRKSPASRAQAVLFQKGRGNDEKRLARRGETDVGCRRPGRAGGAAVRVAAAAPGSGKTCRRK